MTTKDLHKTKLTPNGVGFEPQTAPAPVSNKAQAVSSTLLLKFSVILSSLFLLPPLLPAQPKPVLVAAASDLAPLEMPLNDLYKKIYKREFRFVLGSSGMLATQIRSGAPYDLFLSANQQFVRDLAASSHLLPGSVRVYSSGRLAIWSKSLSINSLDSLTDPRITHIAIANPNHAPYGVAAQQALQRAGLWDKVKDKVVLAENVRQCLQYAETGNAQVALLAWSLVISRNGVLVPASLHDPILQAGGVVAASSRRKDAADLLDLLLSPQGRALLSRFGFSSSK